MIVDLDEVAEAAWKLGNHCLPLSERLWAAGTLASNLPLPFFKVGKLGAGAFKRPKLGAGVYDVTTTGGRYIGQSKNILPRIKQHFFPSGKLNGLDETGRKHYSMPGSTKLQREVYEQYLINQAGGVRNLINVRNPMGGRMDVYESMYGNVIKQFGLPR